jgi:hypothetical protein
MSLPPRGTGLSTGRAGDRQYGQPRTEEERMARHYGTLESNSNTWVYVAVAGGIGLVLLWLWLRK